MKAITVYLALVLWLGFCIGSPIAGAASVLASFYSSRQRVASGGWFNPRAMTAAHRTLPFGTRVRVSRGGRSVTVRINDRGPYIQGRSIDLSRAAAVVLGMTALGVARVDMQVVR